MPAEVSAGVEQLLLAEVCSADGKAVKALIPAEVTIADAEGNVLDGSGYGCAIDGHMEWRFSIPKGTPSGSEYTITITELASGKSIAKTIAVR